MTSNQKLFRYKVVGFIENYNFRIVHVNIRGYLKILNFKIYEIKTNFGTKWFQIKMFSAIKL